MNTRVSEHNLRGSKKKKKNERDSSGYGFPLVVGICIARRQQNESQFAI